MKDFALALGGGGARGIYQIGALKAILEMDINVTAIAGASIGSINGAVFAQGDMDKADELWNSVSIEKIIDMSKNIITNKGFDSTPLKELLTETINEDNLRASPIDFGLTTFSVSDRSNVEVFLEDIPEGKLIDYLLASSCFLGFKLVEIDGKEFIDGGVTNKMPVSMLIERGFKDIIAVDINGPGFAKSVDTFGVNIVTVKNPRKFTGIFEFNPEKLEKTKRIGYLDACKAFGKLQGRLYYFKNSEYEKLRGMYSSHIINGLETCAWILSIENTHEYTAREFLSRIMEKYTSAHAFYSEIKDNLLGINIIDLIRNWKEEESLKSGVILPLLVDLIKENQGGVKRALLKRIVSREFEAAGSVSALTGLPILPK